MKTNIANLLIGVILALIVLSLSLFVVDQRQNAIVFQLGEVVGVKTTPGLYFKIPLTQNVRIFDSRILTLDTGEPERFITAEKKNVMVDSFVKWRIIDVKQYYISVGGDEDRANTRLRQTVNSSMREEFGKRTIHEVVSGEREQIMTVLRNKTDADARKIGIQVLDVRLKRVDFPSEISDSVYRRMDAERKRVANELRASGAADAEKIKADADKQREVILAEAYRTAQSTRVRGMRRRLPSMQPLLDVMPSFILFIAALKLTSRVSRTRAM